VGAPRAAAGIATAESDDVVDGRRDAVAARDLGIVGLCGRILSRGLPRIFFPNTDSLGAALPTSAIETLLREDLRQLLTALDLYCALLIAAPAAYLRFVTGELPADSHAPLTMVLIITMSTMALTLFGLDVESGLARYRLLPLSGWRILLSKGLAYLFLVAVARRATRDSAIALEVPGEQSVRGKLGTDARGAGWVRVGDTVGWIVVVRLRWDLHWIAVALRPSVRCLVRGAPVSCGSRWTAIMQ